MAEVRVKPPVFSLWSLAMLFCCCILANLMSSCNSEFTPGDGGNSTGSTSCTNNTSCVLGNESHRCLYSNASCLCKVDFCPCSEDYYYKKSSGNNCLRVDQLKVTNLTYESETESVNVMWSPPQERSVNTVVYVDGINTNFNSNGHIKMRNRTPGSPYNVTICPDFCVLPAYYNNTRLCQVIIAWTKPAKPGSLQSVRPTSDLNLEYIITFIASEGEVREYQVKINDLDKNVTKRQEENKTVALTVNMSLTPGKTFNYSIIAYNGLKQLNETTGSFPYILSAKNVSDITLSSERNSGTGRIELTISWIPGDYMGPTLYNVSVELKNSRVSNDFPILRKALNNTAVVIDDVLAHRNYTASVIAYTTAGSSDWVHSSEHLTVENYPEAVRNLIVTYEKETTHFTAIFDCLNESQSNGNIQEYVIHQRLLPTDGDVEIFTNHSVKPRFCNSSINLGGSKAERNYIFAVMARNQNYDGNFSNETLKYVPSRAPQFLRNYNASYLLKKPKPSRSDETKIEIVVCTSCLVDSSDGKVLRAGLIVCVESDQNNCTKNDSDTNSAMLFNDTITWKTAADSDFNKPYRITPDDWLKQFQTSDLLYVVGESSEAKCSRHEFCNGPLPVARSIYISVIVCTSGGCQQVQSDDGFMIKPEDPASAGIVAAVVMGVLAVIFVLSLVVFFVYRKMAAQKLTWLPWQKKYEEPEIRQQRPVKVRQFEDHVRKLHKDSNLLFQDEFEDIRKLCMTFKNSCSEAQREANRIKNRYTDILPFDHSRVRMDVQPEDEETNDFINANYIPGYNSVREYIATQGPMYCTIPDFWRMTWEQKCQVIVMVSDLQENGKPKVDQYWPDTLNEPVNYENVVVEMTNFSQLNKYIIRNFKITKNEDSRKVTQFFLPGWWDFSANLSFDDVLEFVKLVRQEITPDTTGPTIVHCSAGVGRTGTFIALDYFMQYLDQHTLDDEMDIFDYVLKMRKCRPRMVQAESQYIFIFDAVQEIIKKKISAERQLEHNENEKTGEQKTNTVVNVPLNDANCVYSNKAFEPELTNTDTSEKKEKPVTEL